MLSRILLLTLLAAPALADPPAPAVFDATRATWSDARVRATQTLEPGMQWALWCDPGNMMCSPATRKRVGPHPLFPTSEFNPQESDLDNIIAEADRRKARGQDPLVILDFEHWCTSPQMYPRIVELLRYFKLKSGRPVGFYPGFLSVGAKNNAEFVSWATGKPSQGLMVDEARRRELAEVAQKVSTVIAECDFIAIDMYISKDQELVNQDFSAWEAIQKFYRHYYPAREVIPFVGSHQAAIEGNPPISLNLLPTYVRVLAKYSTHGRYIVWGQDTPATHALSRLLMGKPVDLEATERQAPRDNDLEAVRRLLQNATSGAPKEDPAKSPKPPVEPNQPKGN